MAHRFKDKTAIITGASSGIGASAARQFIIFFYLFRNFRHYEDRLRRHTESYLYLIMPLPWMNALEQEP
jgi:hypothetical protein